MKNFISKFLGIACLLSAVILIVGSIQNYTAQWEQNDWTSITAEVTDISSRVERSGGGRRSRSRTVYDITYSYEVEGQTYIGQLNGSSTLRLVGDELNIKYDPEAPESSTTIMSPQISSLILSTLLGIVFAVVGFCMSGLLAWILKLRKRGEPEEVEQEEEILPPEEYIAPVSRKAMPNGPVAVILQRVIPLLMMVVMIFIGFSIFSGNKSITAEQFSNEVESRGYTVVDNTELYREQWKVGSLLEQAVSLDTADVRIDFCVMDSMDSTRRLYQGMGLPITEGIEYEKNGVNHSTYTVENDEMYYAKFQFGTTVVYAGCTIENKELVVEILKSIGYLEE